MAAQSKSSTIAMATVGPTPSSNQTIASHDCTQRSTRLRVIALLLLALVLFEFCAHLPLGAQAGEKGRDIIIYDGKVILKGGKKKGNIIISNGSHGQGKYKYKKKYMDYGGYWRR